MKNLLQVNRALRAKKNLNFKSFNSTTKTARGLNEVLCLSKRGFLLLGLLLTLGVGQMWGWYVPGTINGEYWGATDNNMGSDNTITFYAVAAGTYNFQLTNGSDWSGNSCINSVSGCTKGTNGNNATITFTGTKDITISVVDETNWKVSVTASDPTYHLKAGWGGGSWTWQELTNNGDGTYSCDKVYSGGKNFNYIKRSSDSDDDMHYNDGTSGVTLVNSPSSTSDKCIYTFKPSNNTLEIRKCNTVTKTNYLYFDNSTAQWDDSKIQFIIGRASYSKHYEMGVVTNTQLYYKGQSADNWTDVGYYAMIGNATNYGDGDWGRSNIPNATHYSAAYLSALNLASSKVYLINKASATNGTAITITNKGSGSTILNSTQTVKFAVSTNGATPVELSSGTTPAQIRMRSYKFVSGTYASVSAESPSDWAAGSSTYSQTFTAARTATTTLTVSNIDGDYAFLGWYDAVSGGTQLSDQLSYTYYPTEATTVYARFSHEANHTVTVSYTCASPSATVSTSTTPKIGEITYSSQTAPTVAGYTFVNWTLGTGLSKHSSDALTANPIRVKTNSSGSGYTLTANYTEDLSSTWYLNGDANNGSNNSPFEGWGTSGTPMLKKSGYSTVEKYYCTRTVTVAATGDGWGFKAYNSAGADDNHRYYAYSDKIFTIDDNSSTIYTNNGANNMHFKPYITGEFEFELDNTGTSPVLTIHWPIYNQVRISAASSSDASNVGSFDLGAPVSNVRSVTRTLAANTTYTFKVVSNSEWYGYNSGTFTRSTSTSSNSRTLSTSGGNMTLTTDYAGEYTFKFNESTKSLSVDYPEAYRAYFEVGTVKGNKNTVKLYRGSIDNANIISSGTWVLKNTEVYFWAANKTDAASISKPGYTWWGFYNNAAGTGSDLPEKYADDRVSNTHFPITADVHVYAVWGENSYTVKMYNNGNGDVYEGGNIVNATTAHVATASNALTATPQTGYYFTGWDQFADSLTINTPSAATTTIKIKSDKLGNNARLRANFSPRWSVLGSGAFGGWSAYDAHLFDGYTVVSSKDVGYNTITLDANTTYEIKTYDRETSTFYGGSANQDIDYAHSGSGNEYTIATTADPKSVFIHSAAAGSYTLNWNLTDKKIAVVYPTSWFITSGQKTTGQADDAGGSYTAVDNSSKDVKGGKFVADNATVTFTATPNAGYHFDGWFSNNTCTTPYTAGGNITLSGEGNSVLTISSITDDTTAYAKYTPLTYTVTFNPKGGTGLSVYNTTVTMGALYSAGTGLSGSLPTVTPPTGYIFDGWYTAASGGTKVTDETTVAIASDHTLYAHYVQKAQVYFKNTLGWENVYVTYDAYWDTGHDPSWGSGNSGRTYHKMTQISGTDIYYDDIPEAVLSSWKGNICFNSQQLGSIPTGNYANFDHGQAVFRRDFDSDATMFVPVPNDPNKFKLNNAYDGTWYYSTDQVVDKSGDKVTNYRYKNGYWVRYNNVEAGYSLKGSWDSWGTDHYIAKETASGTTYTYTIRGLSANTTYYFKLFKHCATSNTYSSQFSNTGTMTSGNCSNWTFNAANTTGNAGITTTVAGDYTFNFTFGDGEVKLSVDYPFYVGDYKVIYSYTKDGAKTYDSEIIHGRANGLDTISVFIHSSSDASSRSLKIAKCTEINASGVPTWNNSYATINISSVSESGVYNFIITQDGSAAATGAYWNKYTGNYYIRTAASAGGWDMYKYRPDNIMTLSEYSLTQTLSDPFSHYYCRYIESTNIDITYCVATDYSPNISGTMIGDATIGGVDKTKLPASANVRFSWNKKTNALRRAYLKNAQGAGNNRYLVLHGADNKIRNNDATGTTIPASGDLVANELLFTDIGNWVYQVELKAIPGAKVSLIANYNSADRYLVGDGSTKWETIIGGSGSSLYSIKAVYDFKTNRLMTAWIPGGDIDENITDVDVLLLRYAQNAGTAITFNGAYTVGAKEVIGAIEFRYTDLVGHVAAWTSSSRPLLKFFVSFPFDVNVSDIFGLNSAYGDAYVIQKYDGAERASKGFFRGDGTTTFWKDLQPGDVMKANVGYCVIMDNDYLNNDIGHVWDNKGPGSSVYLYFPSASSVGDIESSSETISIPEHLCHHDRTFITGGSREVNHINTDSHWNMMGVPIFDTHSDSGTSGQPGAVFATSGTNGDGNFNYFYEWNPSNNQFSIHTAVNYSFKCMHGYMVQYHGNVTFKTAAAPASVAARRAPQKENYQIELQVLNNNADVLNSAFVELRENACDTFELNEDVYMSFNNLAVNIYTLAGNYDVAANVLSVGNHTIPVCVEITKAGTYTFSMPSNFSGTATLVDSFTGERTNLALDDYEVNLQKGVIEDRFLLEIDVQKVATAIDGTTGSGSLKDGNAHKFLQNGMMYILQNGMLYDAQGKRVQ